MEKKDNTDLFNLVIGKFRDAAMARDTDNSHFENGLTKEIELCHMARRGILDEDEKAIAEELSTVGLEFGKRKAYTALNLMYELVRDSIDRPILEPTAKPEINDDSIGEIVTEMKKEVFLNRDPALPVPTPDEFNQLAESLTLQYTGKKIAIAKKGVEKAEIEIRDKLQEGEYREVNRELLDDFCAMPFCVAKYPSYQYIETAKWKKNKWVNEMKVVPVLERISPFDFFILNGTTPKNADAVFEIRTILINALAQMKGQEGWDDKAIDMILDDDDKQYVYKSQQSGGYFFTANNKEKREYYSYLSHKNNVLTLLESRLTVRGKDLEKSEIGTKEIDKNKFYELHVITCGSLIIYSKIIPDDEPIKRPYFVTSYERINGTWAGIGILQRVRKAEKIARSFLYASIRNASRSAEPAGEINFERVKHFYDNSVENVLNQKGGMYIVESDPSGTAGGAKAVSYYDIPNHTTEFLSAMKVFIDLIDVLSDVPKLSSGDLSGMATLGRSYRGLAMVQQAESKAIRGALDNYDMFIQEPIFKRMYFDLIGTTKDAQIRTGDAQIISRGTSGYLRKETDAAARQETLIQMGDRLAALNPELERDFTMQVLKDQSVDVEPYINKGIASEGGIAPPLGGEDGLARNTSPAFGGQQIPV
jgi:hypothetical protein